MVWPDGGPAPPKSIPGQPSPAAVLSTKQVRSMARVVYWTVPERPSALIINPLPPKACVTILAWKTQSLIVAVEASRSIAPPS